MNVEEDNVIRTSGAIRSHGRERGKEMNLVDGECYMCDKKGHMARTCPEESQAKREERK